MGKPRRYTHPNEIRELADMLDLAGVSYHMQPSPRYWETRHLGDKCDSRLGLNRLIVFHGEKFIEVERGPHTAGKFWNSNGLVTSSVVEMAHHLIQAVRSV